MPLSRDIIRRNAVDFSERWQGKQSAFKTSDLCDYIDHFHDLAGLERHYEIDEQGEVNVQAAGKMAQLHDTLCDSGLFRFCHVFLPRNTRKSTE